jgi:CBS domain-containing protein
MKLTDIMTHGVEIISPDTTVADAADTMRNLDLGALPVCDGTRLVGMLTDRDIIIRAVAEGRDPTQTRVSSCMTPDVIYCFQDQEAEEAEKLMQEKQIRRLPILDRDKQLVGILALADIATKTDDAAETARTIREISQVVPMH